MEEAALRALAKLEQVLPKRLRSRVKALHASIVPMHFASPLVNAEVSASLSLDAVMNRCALENPSRELGFGSKTPVGARRGP